MEKKKTFGRLLKIVGCLVLLCIILLTAAAFLFNSKSFQNRVMHFATDRISTMFATHVDIDSVSIDVWNQSVHLYGLDIEDQQKRKMLEINKMEASLDMMALLRNEIRIGKADIIGLHTRLYKPNPETPANFQFIIDSLQSQHPKKDTVKKKEKKKKLVFDIYKINLKDWSLDFFQDKTDHHAKLQSLQYTRKGEKHRLVIDSLCYANDNHKPRKNVGKPKRGAFDPGHMDVAASLQIDVSRLDKDSIVATLTRCDANDRASGLHVTSLTFQTAANKHVAHLNDVKIKMKETNIEFDEAEVLFPDSTRRLSYTTSTIKGRTLLRDIAKPFAPVLKDFTTPLTFTTQMKGTDDNMSFRDIHVATTDKLLQISANGRITNLKDKYKLNVTFNVTKMQEHGNVKQKIINHFPVKKYMMKQMAALGDISYTGKFSVLWKKEQFQGLLHTEVGDLNFFFALDEMNKYVSGKVNTESLELGKALDMDELGKIVCNANFNFDFSKPRTAQIRKRLGGKLPIGHVDAVVNEVQYKKHDIRNLYADINSNGAIAEGKITIKGKRLDLLCSFIFTNTDSLKKMKIKPGLKFHKLSEKDKAEREELKQQKKEEKAQKKQQKKEEKALRRQEKAEERAEKKQRRAEEKALKKQKKEEEKALRKQQKEERNAQTKQQSE
jgi:hypothetical protein